MNIAVPIALTIAVMITVLCWLWLWFMIARRAKWDSIVDRENAFWVRLGVSASLAETVKRLEKGVYEKVLVGTAAVIGTLVSAALCVLMIVRK
ncbi:MAG TPA: hypothetical protein VGO11_22190 [Chthoniobacteraceae bacterium]|jgi:hypothetical protein|nr:hypothetical protein [Chthoniobacteraceae bacterium]